MKKLILLILILIPVAEATRFFTYEFNNDVTLICTGCNYWMSCDSDSMGRTLGCNDTLLGVEPRSKKEIKVGDILVYKRHKLDKRTDLKYIIHRVIGFDYRGCFKTKGDNNLAEDKYKPCFYDVKFVIRGVIYG